MGCSILSDSLFLSQLLSKRLFKQGRRIKDVCTQIYLQIIQLSILPVYKP